MFNPTNENLVFMRGLLESGLQINVIADYLECNRRTVSRWKQRFLESPNYFLCDARRLNTGVNVLTNEEMQNIRLMSEADPLMPATKIREELMLDCCDRTVRRVLHDEFLLHCFTPVAKTRLFNLDKQKRVTFATNHLNMTEEQWSRTIFIDEKTFSMHKDGRLLVWRPLNTR